MNPTRIGEASLVLWWVIVPVNGWAEDINRRHVKTFRHFTLSIGEDT